MTKSMQVLVVDRSELAGNLYRLLLAPLDIKPLVKRRYEDALHVLLQARQPFLAIFNTNVFGKKFDEALVEFQDEPRLAAMKKVFLYKDDGSEQTHRSELETLDNSILIPRPFHPDELSSAIGRILTEAGK